MRIEFSPEQRAALLPLYVESLYTDEAAETAARRAVVVNRAFWRATRAAIGVQHGGLRILHGFQGVELRAPDPQSRDFDTSIDAVMKEWQDMVSALNHSVSPDGTSPTGNIAAGDQ